MTLRRICGESRGRTTLKAIEVIAVSSVVNRVLPVAALGIALATS